MSSSRSRTEQGPVPIISQEAREAEANERYDRAEAYVVPIFRKYVNDLKITNYDRWVHVYKTTSISTSHDSFEEVLDVVELALRASLSKEVRDARREDFRQSLLTKPSCTLLRMIDLDIRTTHFALAAALGVYAHPVEDLSVQIKEKSLRDRSEPYQYELIAIMREIERFLRSDSEGQDEMWFICWEDKIGLLPICRLY